VSDDGQRSAREPADPLPLPPTAPLRPPPPLAKRLNRNALTVAAALAAVTVLTVLIVTRPSRDPGMQRQSPGAAATAPMPARPAFLDQPPRAESTAVLSGARAAVRESVPAPDTSGLPIPSPIGASDPPVPVGPPGGREDGTETSGGGGSGSGRLSRSEAYQAALTSAVLVTGGAGGSTRAAPVAVRPRSVVRDAAVDTVGWSPRVQESGAETGAPSAPVAPAVTGAAPSSARIEPAGSPYTVRAGTVIPGTLITGVNSDLPGEVLAQTSRDVFDSRTQQVLLIPRASRLIGQYDSRSVGTGRLIVTWTRLVLPDGRGLALPRLAGTDETGEAGLHDRVDHHFGRVYGAALLTSAITAGVQLAQPQQSGLYAAPSSRQVAAGALGQTVGDLSLESARRGLDVPPTVIIRPGYPFDVFLTGDLAFDGPYVETSPTPAGSVTRP